MARPKKTSTTAANIGCEAQLWQYGVPPVGNANFA